MKTGNIYKDITEDAEARFDAINFQLDRPFPNGKHKKVIRLVKDELSGWVDHEKICLIKIKNYSVS